MLAQNLLRSVSLLANASRAFTDKCVKGLEANVERCIEGVERNLAICTALAPSIGYDKAAAISKEALKTNKTIREVAKAWKVLPDEEIDRLLDFYAMTVPSDVLGVSAGG